MATELLGYDMSREAAADMYTTSKQYLIMKLDTNSRAAVADAAAATIIGVLQNKPKIYEAAEVRRGGRSKVICAGAVAIGAFVTSNGTGYAVTATTGQRYCGIALETGEDSRLITIEMEFGKAA